MKNTSTKIAFFAGICLLTAGYQKALSQGCNTGYNMGGYSDYCVPSSPSTYSGFDGYDPCPPRYSQRAYRNNTGNYYGQDNYCSPGGFQTYDTSNQFSCPCPECAGVAGAVNASPNQKSNIESRLSYIETILSFIVNFLGLNDQLEDATSGSPVSPQMNPSAPAAGGS